VNFIRSNIDPIAPQRHYHYPPLDGHPQGLLKLAPRSASFIHSNPRTTNMADINGRSKNDALAMVGYDYVTSFPLWFPRTAINPWQNCSQFTLTDTCESTFSNGLAFLSLLKHEVTKKVMRKDRAQSVQNKNKIARCKTKKTGERDRDYAEQGWNGYMTSWRLKWYGCDDKKWYEGVVRNNEM